MIVICDFATHARPLRERANYMENLFARTVDGNVMIDAREALAGLKRKYGRKVYSEIISESITGAG